MTTFYLGVIIGNIRFPSGVSFIYFLYQEKMRKFKKMCSFRSIRIIWSLAHLPWMTPLSS